MKRESQATSPEQQGIIVIYIGIAVIGNFITWLLINMKQKNTPSPLLEVEKQNWLENALISTGIGVSFLLVLIFGNGVLKPIVPYVDEIVVLIAALEDEYSPCNLDIVITRQEDYQR